MPDLTQLFIAGGGPAALEAVLAVQRLAGERFHIMLLSDRDEFVYRPVAVAEPFALGSPERFSLRRLAADRGLELIQGVLRAVDPAGHRVLCANDDEIPYDVLLLALGARADVAVPGALTFRGPQDSARLRSALQDLDTSAPRRIAFAASPETAWTLPLYEMALMTARWGAERDLALETWVVTHEHQPLGIFGERAAGAVGELLADAGVRLWTGAFAEAVENGRLWVGIEGGLPVDLAVALPRFYGPAIRGLPSDDNGFLEIDQHGRVRGVADVFAAGDMTSRPLKQGGLATQQADAAAAAIAAAAGAEVEAEAYRPVLRATLLTGGRPRYLRHSALDGDLATDDAPWWPPHKIAGRELAPYLTAHPELRLESVKPIS